MPNLKDWRFRLPFTKDPYSKMEVRFFYKITPKSINYQLLMYLKFGIQKSYLNQLQVIEGTNFVDISMDFCQECEKLNTVVSSMSSKSRLRPALRIYSFSPDGEWRQTIPSQRF